MRILVNEPCALLEFLQSKIPSAAKTRLRKMLKYGGVMVDGAVAKRGDQALQPGQVVEIHRVDAARAIEPPLPLVYDDQWLMVVDKPSGLLSIAAVGEDAPSAYGMMGDYVRASTHGRGRVYIVHRLDRSASGLLMLAKSLEVKKTLQRHWDRVEKRYLALAEGRPPKEAGTIRGWLREARAQKMQVCDREPGARLAVTHYRVKKTLRSSTLLEVGLETGRRNQIRVHLASIGCPVVGDKKYGAQSDPLRRLALHACLLAFPHPVTGEMVRLELPMPDIFRAFLRAG